MRKNLHDRILKGEPNEQHRSIVPKFYSYQLYLVHVILKTSHDCAIKITKKKKKFVIMFIDKSIITIDL